MFPIEKSANVTIFKSTQLKQVCLTEHFLLNNNKKFWLKFKYKLTFVDKYDNIIYIN